MSLVAKTPDDGFRAARVEIELCTDPTQSAVSLVKHPDGGWLKQGPPVFLSAYRLSLNHRLDNLLLAHLPPTKSGPTCGGLVWIPAVFQAPGPKLGALVAHLRALHVVKRLGKSLRATGCGFFLS